MTFQSILFNRTENTNGKELKTEVPSFFRDLNLDQIVSSITSGKEEYNLKPFFYSSLNDINTILYRQEIMLDIENKDLLTCLETFASSMQQMRQQLALIKKLYYKHQKERLFVDVVQAYCETVRDLESNLSHSSLQSNGLLNFRGYLKSHLQSDSFTSLLHEVKSIISDLSSVRYFIYICGLRVQVLPYKSETDFSAEVEELFSKFKEGNVSDYKCTIHHSFDMNEVESQILDGVAELYPDFFLNLSNFCQDHQSFTDEVITIFDREIQFYISYINYMAQFKKEGLKFCYPQVSGENKAICDYEVFDLALARSLIAEKTESIVNDFYLKDKERILVVSGPNQGGKTTFARIFGQIHFLAGIGCPVPGQNAQLFIFDKLFTHFEREENIKNLHGKLQDELYRIHQILVQASPDSILIINEIFTSTTLQDQIFLSKKIMQQIIELDLLGVWVTFIDELASFGYQTVSMVSSIVPENPAMRTYKISRKPADGLAYALSLAEKHQLTYNQIRKRIML